MNKLRSFLVSCLLMAMNIGVYAQLEKPAPVKGEILLRHSAYICSFNTDRLTPNYVAWCLTPDRVNGKTKRTDFFDGDPMIQSRYRVIHGDYSNSRYDRGHMCPAADNRQSLTAMTECFYMTNMCPQNHGLNTGAWNDLEIQCRSWACNYKKIYVVSGPIYKDNPLRIGRRKGFRIAVPDSFFKVVLMMGKTPKAIGFIYGNRNYNDDIRDHAVTVDKVEQLTGLDFFPQLDDRTEKKIEAECKPAAWGI
ncbi:MAG: DNA/RNA non-specific endonuclease [Bacteroidaceae bacterium]|nr:DNA/RNA non-specific endonuclease [Bacteroidaceae bacterium]